MRVTKAIIPIAGKGTRMYPLSRVVPKALLPIGSYPVIHYVVEEAVKAGIEEMLFITGDQWELVRSYFDQVKPFDIKIHYIPQLSQLGLGDAVKYGREFCDGDPFALLLGDAILEDIKGDGVLKEMVKLYDDHNSSIVAIEEVPSSEVHRYGIMKGFRKAGHEGLYEVEQWIEKPTIEQAPSNFAIAARYVLSPGIFDLLDRQTKGYGGEIQLTDALNGLLENRSMLAYSFAGKRHDTGNPLDLIKANVSLGRKSNDFGRALQDWLDNI